MSRLWLLLSLAAPTAAFAAPGDLTLEVSPLVVGAQAEVTISGARPNAPVRLFWSDAVQTGGFCPPLLGGDCMDLSPPLSRLAVLQANGNGVARAVFPFPAVPPTFDTVALQAGYLLPGGGVDTSNALQVTLHQADSDLDGDGLLALDEVQVHGTDPDLADSDGGGTDDGIELAGGTDPADSADDAGIQAVVVRGMSLYESPVPGGNSFACASCHALEEPAADGLRRPGHPIGDAVARSTWKNGQLTEVRDAVNSCRDEWMNAPDWSPADPDWMALRTFLEANAPATAPDLSYTIVPAPQTLTGGDVGAGEALFNGSCSVCHGEDGAGTQQAPPVVGFGLDAGYVAQRIRTSGRVGSGVYTGLTGGIMPFWSEDRLSDDEVRDLVAYLGVTGTPTPGDTGMDTDVDTDIGPTGCSTTHARVGQTATFTNFFHGIAGQVEIVDDCTAEITNFFYDGRGITVEVYGRRNGVFDLSMSGELVRPQPYTGETIYATLPQGQTWDDVDALSIWCVRVGIDFGSAILP
jgi:mono/diheme cytochrome c family protein